MQLYGSLTAHETILRLTNDFGQGVESFNHHGKFVELNKRAREAADIVKKEFVVRYFCITFLDC